MNEIQAAINYGVQIESLTHENKMLRKAVRDLRKQLIEPHVPPPPRKGDAKHLAKLRLHIRHLEVIIAEQRKKLRSEAGVVEKPAAPKSRDKTVRMLHGWYPEMRDPKP